MDEVITVSKEGLMQIIQAEVERVLQERGFGAHISVNDWQPWKQVRAELEARLRYLPATDVERYTVLSALMTVIRKALGLKLIRLMSTEQKAEAREIGHAVLDLMRVPRGRKDEEAPAAEAGAAPVEGES